MTNHAENTTPAVAFESLPGARIMAMVRRFLLPPIVVSAYAYLRWQARVSPRAEVELSGRLRLGRRTAIGSFCKFKATRGPIATGEDCDFAPGCFVSAGGGGVEIGDRVAFGANVAIIASNYRYDHLNVPLREQGRSSIGIRIGDDVRIEPNAVILDGAIIGANSMVLANSVVSGRFPPNSTLQGNPAKPLRNPD